MAIALFVFFLGCFAAAVSGAFVGLDAPAVKGGMTVSNLRLASSDGNPSSILFGSSGSEYKMGMDGDTFKLSSPHDAVFAVNQNDTLSILSSFAVRSLELRGDLSANGVRQFRMVAHEDYSSGVAKGWDNKAEREIVSKCAGINMLGGYGKFAKGEVTKKFENLPPHSELRVKATYHFLDAWIGETGFMRMNIGSDGSMVYVWTDRHSQSLEQEAGATGEGKFASPVEVTVPHNSDSVQIGFGSTLQSDDPYDQSWGVSGIEIYVR